MISKSQKEFDKTIYQTPSSWAEKPKHFIITTRKIEVETTIFVCQDKVCKRPPMTSAANGQLR
jgi:hypothetical protein